MSSKAIPIIILLLLLTMSWISGCAITPYFPDVTSDQQSHITNGCKVECSDPTCIENCMLGMDYILEVGDYVNAQNGVK